MRRDCFFFFLFFFLQFKLELRYTTCGGIRTPFLRQLNRTQFSARPGTVTQRRTLSVFDTPADRQTQPGLFRRDNSTRGRVRIARSYTCDTQWASHCEPGVYTVRIRRLHVFAAPTLTLESTSPRGSPMTGALGSL